MKKHKSYNPFKMWGSWIGGLILSLPMLWMFLSLFMGSFETILQNSSDSTKLGVLGIGLICSGGGGSMWCLYSIFIVAILIQFIVGFLIGWGIHSLIRKLTRGRI